MLITFFWTASGYSKQNPKLFQSITDWAQPSLSRRMKGRKTYKEIAEPLFSYWAIYYF